MRAQVTRTRAWSVELCSEFETGAGVQLRSSEPGVATFLAPWDSSPQPMWFHFRIRGAKGWRVRFALMNASLCLGGPKGYADLRVRPVVTEDPPTMPPSRRRWRRVPKANVSHDEDTGRFSFEANIHSDEAYVAHCYPYGPAEWEELLADFSGCRWLASSSIGKTAQGRPMPQARITEGRSAQKKVIWLTARHHCGETPGSWALEGTLRWLLSDDRRAEYLRKRYLFRVVPFADLDGVVEGYYGKERAPLDFNRAYVEDTPRPEIEHILRELSATGPRNLAFFDYHAPGAGGDHHLYIKTVSERTEQVCRQLGGAIAEASPARSRLDPKRLLESSYMGDEKEVTSTGGAFLAQRILTMTFEVSYALTSDDRVLTRKDYLAYGAAVGKALHKVLHARADEIETAGLADPEDQLKPFPTYRGKAFLGGFQWRPGQDVGMSAEEDAQGEVLRIGLRKKSSSLHMACPRHTIGKRQELELAWRFVPKSKRAAVRAQVTIFYYGPRGLRFRKDEKLSLDTARAGTWQNCRVRLNPPKGARKVRVSIRLDGGPGQFALRQAMVT